MLGATIWLGGKELAITMLRSPLLHRPVFLLLVGLAIELVIAPGWFGVYGNVKWLGQVAAAAGFIIALALARGALNYVNGRNFWTGTKVSAYVDEYNRLARDVEDTRIALAFIRWAARSQLKVELSSDQRESLLKEIRAAILQLTPEDVFREPRQRAEDIVKELEIKLESTRSSVAAVHSEAKRAREEVVKVQRMAGEKINEVALSVLAGESIALFREKVQEEVENIIAEKVSSASLELSKLSDTLHQSIREAVEREVSALIRSSPIDRRLNEAVPFHFREIEEGILRFLGQQMRRANVYLFSGIVIGLSGVSLFAFYFVSLPQDPNIWVLLTRAGLLLAFEAFAMFFLRLYKASLSEIAFFQNELTTVRSKKAGLHVAVQVAAQHDYKPLTDAVAALLSLDRNSTFDKGQTSRVLEEKRLNSKEQVELIRAASEVVRAARGK